MNALIARKDSSVKIRELCPSSKYTSKWQNAWHRVVENKNI